MSWAYVHQCHCLQLHGRGHYVPVMGGYGEGVEVDVTGCCNGNVKMKEDGLKTNAALNEEKNVAQRQDHPRRSHDYARGAYGPMHWCSCPRSTMAQQSDSVLGH